ncbi:MAG: NDP-hexose 2,3-dehydratase family protein [bacterium]|nr:NDP-hexose 2,3-dehydratase family protein [bacterium]
MLRTSFSTFYKLMESWAARDGVICPNKDILEWINFLNSSVHVVITKNRLSDSSFWFYDENEGVIKNKNDSFFKIAGIRATRDDKTYISQPIILQDEIGMLGFICKEIDGLLYFLVQAKIEPGNINKIQLSPTIQATKSNFTQKHGGKRPLYIDYFMDDKYMVIADRIQSEQSSRFLKKRNRNMIIKLDDNEEIEVSPMHKWMTLGQLKHFMRFDNLVNMDSRTVISSIPFSKKAWSEEEASMIGNFCREKCNLNSLISEVDNAHIQGIYKKINDYRMFDSDRTEIVKLADLDNWSIGDDQIVCNTAYHFKVIFCDISIDGREVINWTQPLFEANGIANFGLLLCESAGATKFLVKLAPELGCFDKVELGPTIQQEAGTCLPVNNVTDLFCRKLEAREGIIFDQLLSEEGGRFYHEQNRNILMKVDERELGTPPEGYFLASLSELVNFIQDNNTVNIQLRNLISLLEV